LDPNMAAWLRYRGIFSDEEPIELSVCHHCSNGGFRADENAQTTIGGLYAAGECMTGPHGADRRGGHMLAATQVFGARAGRHAGRRAGKAQPPPIQERALREAASDLAALGQRRGSQSVLVLRQALQESNWRDLLWGRSEQGLDRVQETVDNIREQMSSDLHIDSTRSLVQALELENMLDVTEVVARVARMRQETRGSHYRLDFPERNDDEWLKSITVKRVNGEMKLGTVVLDPGWQDRAKELDGFRWG
jgi:fumarate reductase (CoM/CoB) subunit A